MSRRWTTSAVAELPRALRCYVLAVPALALALAGWLLRSVSLTPDDVLLAGLLLAAGALSVETTRRVGQPAGTMVRDMLSVWWLPMAVLLPPVYVLFAPVPLLALTQWRVRRSPLYRRVFSAGAIGLAYASASMVFAALHPVDGGPVQGDTLRSWVLGAAAAGVLGAVLNALLIATAVRTADPESSWRDLLADVENLRLEAVEMCVGVTVALLVGLEPELVVLSLPPVLMLQRGLLLAHLRAVALLDSKTGLLNAASWEREAAGKLLALHRRSQPAAVLLIDIDHFKRVNDDHGHLVGDRVLREVAAALSGGVRDGDLLGRFGGEEFVALLPATDEHETARVAERVREQVAGLVVALADGVTVRVTVSVGAAVVHGDHLPVAELLAGADYCMYQAKAAGRNTVVLSAPGAPLPRPTRATAHLEAS